jgi:DNA-directed RNA polymerase subunit K/omega
MSVISATQIPRTTGKFEFVVLATLRAAQLMRGCVPKIATNGHKPTVVALLEVAGGEIAGLPRSEAPAEVVL